MRRLWEVGLFFVGVAFGFLGQALIEASVLQLAYISFSIAGACFLGSFLLWMNGKLWPRRDNWYAISSYPHELPPNNPQRAIDKNRREQWRSSDPQEAGAWFEIDMAKPRTIASIRFLADDHDIEKPKKWRMMFYREDINGPGQTLGHKDGEYDISVRGEDIPNPIQRFRVEIKETAEDMPARSNYAKRNATTKVFWTISFIKVREYRLGIRKKRFWQHEL